MSYHCQENFCLPDPDIPGGGCEGFSESLLECIVAGADRESRDILNVESKFKKNGKEEDSHCGTQADAGHEISSASLRKAHSRLFLRGKVCGGNVNFISIKGEIVELIASAKANPNTADRLAYLPVDADWRLVFFVDNGLTN